MLGPFGIEQQYGTIWNGMFLTTLLAHVAMGVVLGLIEQKWGKYPGVFFAQERAEVRTGSAEEFRSHIRA